MEHRFSDPTAGETARGIRHGAGEGRRVEDPTDPRYGQWRVPGRQAGKRRWIVDPTDGRCGQPAD
jgi:hypothetical protein